MKIDFNYNEIERLVSIFGDILVEFDDIELRKIYIKFLNARLYYHD